MVIELETEHVTEVFTAFGQLGVRAEDVAKEVLRQAEEYLAAGVPVGTHLADQLLLPLGIGAYFGFAAVASRPSTRQATAATVQVGAKQACKLVQGMGFPRNELFCELQPDECQVHRAPAARGCRADRYRMHAGLGDLQPCRGDCHELVPVSRDRDLNGRRRPVAGVGDKSGGLQRGYLGRQAVRTRAGNWTVQDAVSWALSQKPMFVREPD